MATHSPLHSVAHAVAKALPAAAALTPEDVAELLAPPPDRAMGELAFPCFRLAKALRKPPAAIAADLAAAVTGGAEGPGPIQSAAASGPYVNLRLDIGQIGAAVAVPLARGLPAPEPSRDCRVMVEFSQPNTHKAFHVGHMRNLCLGDAIVRLLRAEGYPVIAANYLGDVGAHIAKCLWWYLDMLDAAARTPPATHRGEWLGELYAAASAHLEDLAARAGDDPQAAERLAAAQGRITQILQDLEARSPQITRVWEETRRWSLQEFDEIYAWCGVTFDRVYYESQVDEAGLALVETHLARGTFTHSEGAVGIFNDEVPHMPFFMLRKSDGTGLYATKDLALAQLKFDEERVDRSIYVVDARQTDHFRHVFLTLKKMGIAQADRCEHVPYEMVELPDGPMATRKGNVILFRALRERMTDYVRDNYLAKYRGDWPDDEIDHVAHQVALGAIKYGMLARDVNQKIVFDLEAWLQLEGNTGPYLQYVVARGRSILRRADEVGKHLDPQVLDDEARALDVCATLDSPEERDLLMALAGLTPARSRAAEQLRPSVLCTFLFDLAKRFNRFNKACPVKPSEGALLQGRLLLVQATVEALRVGLDLLGIPAPERM